jgi:integrase
MMLRFTEITGINDITELTRERVETWIKHLREKEKGRNGQPLAPNTIKSNLEFLRILLNFAIEKIYITENAAAMVKFSAKAKIRIRSYTNAEARLVLERARRETIPYRRWLPWLCCFTGCRLDEPAGAMVRDIEKVGPYWVLNVRLDHRHEGASIKTEESDRRVPLHPALETEGFTAYWQSLPKHGPLFPELRPDRFGSKGGNATKRIGPIIRGLAEALPSLADMRLHPSHSWRHRLHDEFRRADVREDIEDAIIGHATDGSAPGYGEYAMIDMLGPAIEKTRSPFDVEPA